jgi:hypothetical protein
MRKSIISAIALGTLASVALLYATAPAAAARKTCEQRAAACESRCAKAYKDYTPCIYRTCVKQYGTCGKG